jgi:pyruvate formate lyase activating enzyme
MDTGIVFDIKHFAIHDGPGIRTTLFLKGCPLSCWWCHNPESQTAQPDVLHHENLCVGCSTCVETCPEGARAMTVSGMPVRDEDLCIVCGTCMEACPADALESVGRRVTADTLMAEIEKDTSFFDQSGGGVTFSGGEPLVQWRFLGEMLDRCAGHDIHTTVDTCGFAKPAVLLSIAEKADLFLFDLKLMDPRRHLEATGVDNYLILENLKTLVEMGKPVRVRVPVIPGVTDSEDNLDAIADFVSTLETPPGVTLLPHHPTAMEKYGRFDVERRLPEGTGTPSPEAMKTIATRLGRHGLQIAY